MPMEAGRAFPKVTSSLWTPDQNCRGLAARKAIGRRSRAGHHVEALGSLSQSQCFQAPDPEARQRKHTGQPRGPEPSTIAMIYGLSLRFCAFQSFERNRSSPRIGILIMKCEADVLLHMSFPDACHSPHCLKSYGAYKAPRSPVRLRPQIQMHYLTTSLSNSSKPS